MEQIKEEISRLKREKNAIILAHYYTPQEVQKIADAVGDSFYLSRLAKETKHSILVFCGVSFNIKSRKKSTSSRTTGRLSNGTYGKCRED